MGGDRKRPKDRRYYRATVGGVVFAVGMLLIAAAAINLQRSLLFVVFGLMAGAAGVSVVRSRRMLSGVEVVRDMPERAFANEVMYLGYRLRRSGGPVIGLEVEEVDAPAELQSVGAFCLYVPRGGLFRSGTRFVVRRRGRYALGRIRLSTLLPFGLVRARRELARAASLVVWPALGKLRAELLDRGAAEVSNTAPSQVRSGADEFFGVREYRQGDNLRWIHWKRTAAAGVPVVREMAKPRPEVLFVVMDTQLSGPDAPAGTAQRRERLIRFAATLVGQAFHRQYRVGVALAYRDRVAVLPAGSGRGHRAALLDALAEIDENADRPLAATLASVPRGLIRDAHVVVVGPDAGRDRAAEALRGACRRVSVVSDENVEELFEDNPFVAGGGGEEAA